MTSSRTRGRLPGDRVRDVTRPVRLVSLLWASALAGGCLAIPDRPTGDAVDGGPDDGDGGGESGDGGEIGCVPESAFHPLMDDFGSGTYAWGQRRNDGAGSTNTITVSGSLSIVLAGSADSHTWIESPTYAAGNLRVTAEILSVPDTSSSAIAWFGFVGTRDEWTFQVEALDLDDGFGGRVRYDPSLHRWWQVRLEDNLTMFETSPNGVDWHLLSAVPGPNVLDQVKVVVGTGLLDAEADRGAMAIDNLNLPPDRCGL